MIDFIFLVFVIVVPVIVVKLLDLFFFKRLFKNKKIDNAQLIAYILIILLIAIYKNNF